MFGFSSIQFPKAKSRRSKPPTAIPPTSSAKRFRQTYLDLGQAQFDSQTCRKCGMVYTPGVEDSEHLKFCKSNSDDIIWILSKDTDILQDFQTDGVVLVASQSDPRCKRLKLLVEAVLGFCEPESFDRSTTSFAFIFF
jgi:hypothetical protein